MAEFKLMLYHDGKGKNITGSAGNITWTDSLDGLGTSFEFECLKGPYAGDIAVLEYGGKEIFRGTVLTVGFSDPSKRTVTGRDYAWYLTQSECVIQFKKIAASQAIQKLCDRYSVPIGSIVAMNTLISQVYKDETVYDIIADILEQAEAETGQEYRMEMRGGKLYVIKQSYTKITPYYISEEGKKVYSADTAGITGTRSIEEMKNQIIVAGTGEDSLQIKATVKDSASIAKYGLLTLVETEDNLTEAKARNIGKTKLKQLNRIETSFTATMQGGITAQAGRLIEFNRPEIGLSGWYKINSCKHQITEGKHILTCEMVKP